MKINIILLLFGSFIVFSSASFSYEEHLLQHTDSIRNCTVDEDCYDFEKCGNNTCSNACKLVSCGTNAWCKAKYHNSVCVCRPGLMGDPLTKCVRRNCTIANDCYKFEKCEDGSCINVCQDFTCGKNAKCDSKNHVAVCTCSWGLTGDPLIECLPRSCNTSYDCYDDEICEKYKCTKACGTISCGVDAWCDVKNHTANCHCMTNYTGDPFTECIRPNCTDNTSCYKFEKCENNRCVPACKPKWCGENAWCNIKDHNATCTCVPGLVGDPMIKCVAKSCNTSDDCSPSHKCENKKCFVACEDVLCGPGMWCKSNNHLGVCSCMDKYSGDINTGCVRNNCTADSDCYRSELCDKNECIPACDLISCGQNEWCYVKDHIAACTCLKGSTRDPLRECVNELEEFDWWSTSVPL